MLQWKECVPPRSDLPPPSPRSGHIAVAVHSELWATDFVIVYGGLSDKKEFLADCVVFEASEEQWIRPLPVDVVNPGARAFHAGCSIGSRLYIFGGSWSPRNRHEGDVWVLDTDDWRWTILETVNQPQPRDFPALLHIGGPFLVLYGGYSGSKFMSDVHILDITTGIWREVLPEGFGAQQPAPRSGHAAAVVAQRLAILGGETTGNAMLSDLWTLRGLLGDGPVRWTKLAFRGQAPSARGAHTIADMGTKLVVFGGHGEEGFLQRRSVYHGDVHVLDRQPESGPIWLKPEVAGDAPLGRAYHTLTAVGSSRALLFGGCNGTQKATFGDAWWLIMGEGQAVSSPSQAANDRLWGLQLPFSLGISSGASETAAPKINHHKTLSSDGERPMPEKKADSSGPIPHTSTQKQSHDGRGDSPGTNDSGALRQLEEFRLSIGLPRRAEQTGWKGAGWQATHQMLALGRRELTRRLGAAPVSSAHEECLAEARSFLSQVETREIRLVDITALLEDCRSLANPTLSSSRPTAGVFEEFSKTEARSSRFIHMFPDQIRMSDVPSLLEDYRYLLAISASNEH